MEDEETFSSIWKGKQNFYVIIVLYYFLKLMSTYFMATIKELLVFLPVIIKKIRYKTLGRHVFPHWKTFSYSLGKEKEQFLKNFCPFCTLKIKK